VSSTAVLVRVSLPTAALPTGTHGIDCVPTWHRLIKASELVHQGDSLLHLEIIYRSPSGSTRLQVETSRSVEEFAAAALFL